MAKTAAITPQNGQNGEKPFSQLDGVAFLKDNISCEEDKEPSIEPGGIKFSPGGFAVGIVVGLLILLALGVRF